MSTPPQLEYEHPLDTLNQVKHALKRAQTLAASGDTHGARRHLRGIRESLQHCAPSSPLYGERHDAQEMWTAAVADLMAACEALGEPLDDDKLASAATLFADLMDRGVCLGAEPD